MVHAHPSPSSTHHDATWRAWAYSRRTDIERRAAAHPPQELLGRLLAEWPAVTDALARQHVESLTNNKKLRMSRLSKADSDAVASARKLFELTADEMGALKSEAAVRTHGARAGGHAIKTWRQQKCVRAMLTTMLIDRRRRSLRRSEPA